MFRWYCSTWCNQEASQWFVLSDIKYGGKQSNKTKDCITTDDIYSLKSEYRPIKIQILRKR